MIRSLLTKFLVISLSFFGGCSANVNTNDSYYCLGMVDLYDNAINSLNKNIIYSAKGYEELSVIALKDFYLQLMENKIIDHFKRNNNGNFYCEGFSKILGVNDIYQVNKNIKYSELSDSNYKKHLASSIEKDAADDLKIKWHQAYKKKLEDVSKDANEKRYKYVDGCEERAETLAEVYHAAINTRNVDLIANNEYYFRQARTAYQNCLKKNVKQENAPKESESSNNSDSQVDLDY